MNPGSRDACRFIVDVLMKIQPYQIPVEFNDKKQDSASPARFF